jgi:hypothetical protein
LEAARKIYNFLNEILTMLAYNTFISTIRRIEGIKTMPSWRKRNYLARIGIFLIMAALITRFPGPYGVGGDDDHPSQNLEIRTWYDLDAIRDNLGGNHTLMNDLDSTTAGYEELAGPTANQGKGWEPIGFFIYTSVSSGCSGPEIVDGISWFGLTGTFDGQGHEIRDLFINPDKGGVGLFAYVNEDGIIKNVGVVNVTVIGDGPVGGLVGRNEGTVSNSYSTGNVTGNDWGSDLVGSVGGLVGSNRGTVFNSYSTGNVIGYLNVGGLVGAHWWGDVLNSYSTGNVIGEGEVGGLVGENHCGDVFNSYSTGNVTGTYHVGGLVGWNYEGSVSNSSWNMETSGQVTSDGGTGKTTAEMQNIATFTGAGWDIVAVALNETNPTYIWNIVNNVTYPFLSWEP